MTCLLSDSVTLLVKVCTSNLCWFVKSKADLHLTCLVLTQLVPMEPFSALQHAISNRQATFTYHVIRSSKGHVVPTRLCPDQLMKLAVCIALSTAALSCPDSMLKAFGGAATLMIGA